MPNCPTCDETVSVPADAVTSEIVACEACQAELEVIELDPPVLALAPEMAEDWGE